MLESYPVTHDHRINYMWCLWFLNYELKIWCLCDQEGINHRPTPSLIIEKICIPEVFQYPHGRTSQSRTSIKLRSQVSAVIISQSRILSCLTCETSSSLAAVCGQWCSQSWNTSFADNTPCCMSKRLVSGVYATRCKSPLCPDVGCHWLSGFGAIHNSVVGEISLSDHGSPTNFAAITTDTCFMNQSGEYLSCKQIGLGIRKRCGLEMVDAPLKCFCTSVRLFSYAITQIAVSTLFLSSAGGYRHEPIIVSLVSKSWSSALVIDDDRQSLHLVSWKGHPLPIASTITSLVRMHVCVTYLSNMHWLHLE